MKLYFAPMEGLTNYIYRQVHASFFPGCDRYFSPFVAPDASGKFKRSALRDLLPENNPGIELVPQVLCNQPRAFLAIARELQAMGYTELNLNAGCPSATVVPKHKGAGMLSDLESLDNFLDEVFSLCPLKVSVKTRLGLDSVEEFPQILDIYNKYPLSELIIHARDRAGMYKSPPDIEAFGKALDNCKSPCCYNGNIFSQAAYTQLLERFPLLEQVMLGRGAIANPALFRIVRGGEPIDAKELQFFLGQLLSAFQQSGLGERYCLSKLKEQWYYLSHMFPGCAKGLKAIYKAQYLSDYKAALSALFAQGGFRPDWEFQKDGI